MLVKIPQPVRETFSALSILFLVAAGYVAFTRGQSNEHIMWLAECALVFSILSETYAKDYKEDA